MKTIQESEHWSKMRLESDVLHFHNRATLRVIPQLGCYLSPTDIPFTNMYLKVKG